MCVCGKTGALVKMCRRRNKRFAPSKQYGATGTGSRGKGTKKVIILLRRDRFEITAKDDLAILLPANYYLHGSVTGNAHLINVTPRSRPIYVTARRVHIYIYIHISALSAAAPCTVVPARRQYLNPHGRARGRFRGDLNISPTHRTSNDF